MDAPNGSFYSFSPGEWGLPPKQPDPVPFEGQPRGNAQFVTPHAAQFAGLANAAYRTYWPGFDEAMSHSRENARVMRLDPVIDACMRLRTYPVALLPFHVAPDDDQNEREAQAAAVAEKLLGGLPGMLYAKRWLLDQGIFVGRAGVKMRWQWVNKQLKNWHLPTAFEPLAGDKLAYKWDNSVGIRVNGMFGGPYVNDGWSRIYVLTPDEREQLIVANFEPSDADFYLPQRAGQVHGLGLRDKLYWVWALKSQVWGLGLDFLRWFARGLTVYYYEWGNKAHLTEVQDWVRGQQGEDALFFPRMRDGGPGYKPVERFEAGTASPQFIQQLVTEYFDDLIRQIILGQSLMSRAEATGLGSGVAAAHQTTADIRIKYDAVGMIDEPFTRDLLAPWYRANYPGMAPGKWVSDVDNPNVQQMLEGAETVYNMGGRVPESVLLEAIGLPEVKPGDTILTNVQPMQPAAVGALPENVPVVNGEPVKMSRRQFLALTTRARTDGRVRRWCLQRRQRFVVQSPWGVPA